MNYILYANPRKYNLKEYSIYNNQNKRHLGINLTKDSDVLYRESCTTLLKEVKKIVTNGACL